MTMPKKKGADGTAFKKSESDELFALIKDPKTGDVKIVVGNNIVSSKKFDSFENAEKYIESKPYELIINTSCLFMHFSNQNENNNENDKV